MKRTKRILLGLACVLLLVASWVAAVTAKNNADRQRELIDQAASYTADEIYILAVPLLEEAAAYQDDYTLEAEAALKQVYLHLAGKDDYVRRYTDLLDKQMARANASPEIFMEAAQYYLDAKNVSTALSALRDGIEKTGDEGLARLYEDSRYEFTLSRDFYDEAATLCNGTSQVAIDGQWGLASSSGLLTLPCEYDKISTFDGDRAIVHKDGVISAVDKNNNRVALLHKDAEDFGNYIEKRLGLKTAEGWLISGGSFGTGENLFEEVGAFSDGYAPAKLNGKWGLIAANGIDWLLEPQYEEIIQDELGRCYAQKAVFIRRSGSVYLLVDGEEAGGPYADARPFGDKWAAVKQNGKWGFIDTEGTIRIDFQFDDALSFGQHLAAVKLDGLWGYVSLLGEVAIEPQFLEAKSFSDGCAPVKTGLGWQFLTLLEYEKGGGLF